MVPANRIDDIRGQIPLRQYARSDFGMIGVQNHIFSHRKRNAFVGNTLDGL